MTRPKVPDDKRQRTAQACDTCKRRKQKCNGQKPCNTCTKRSMTCTYTPSNSADQLTQAPTGSPTKRRHIEDGLPDDSPVGGDSSKPTPIMSAQNHSPVLKSMKSTSWEGEPPPKEVNGSVTAGADEIEPRKPPVEADTGQRTITTHDFDTRSRQSTISGPEEEAEVYTETRMLQDPTGRLLYVGDSATLSYLQLIRMVVENSAGTSPFTLDPSRHKIMENTISLPPNIRPPHILPDFETAKVLVESYFTNTCGLIEIFNRASFEKMVEACYNDPLSADSSFLCLLYLTFAIGLVMATPVPGTRKEETIKRLRAVQFDRAEAFFRSAKCLADPVSGFEDADFWSVQALSLMSVYMLAVSKRNAAYAYYGMAVRSAFALGLHRVLETRFIFKGEEAIVRRNLWRSLFVLDRFLAASLGRPTAISEDDCSSDALDAPANAVDGDQFVPAEPFANAGLDASVESCKVIGCILKRVYAKRKATTRIAQDFADDCRKLDPYIQGDLNHKKVLSADVSASHGIAILHANLLYYHSVILFTRPFFLYLIIKDLHREKTGGSRRPSRLNPRMEKFASACVTTSSHTIDLVQRGFERSFLSRRNPFVLYFLFAASLIILSNEFAGLHSNPTYDTDITRAIDLIDYCSKTDPQAKRLMYILTTFRDVVLRKRQASSDRRAMAAYVMSPGGSHHPMASIFPHEQANLHGSAHASFAEGGRKGPLATPLAAQQPGGTAMAPPPGVSVKATDVMGGGACGVSPASTGGYSQGDGVSGRHMSDVDTGDHIGDEEVSFDSLWHWSGAPNPGAVQISEGASMQTASSMGQYAPYFLGESGTPAPAGDLVSSVPLYATTQYQRNM